jgi:hypothetical protein
LIQGDTGNIFCNSEAATPGEPTTKNGFLYECPRTEGRQASLDPFTNEASEAGYTAIAISNRFDLADQKSGQNCGEYRIVFARNSGFTNGNDRNLIIFEALVPNPDPPNPPVKPTPDNIFVNLKGCQPIVEFWLSLSNTKMTTEARGKALHDFFLYGLPKNSIAKGLPKDDIPPIVAARHYAGGPGSGQIRTNQFMKGGDWLLREFKIDGSAIVPATAKTTPGNSLFALRGDPRRFEFAEYLASKDALNHLRGGVDDETGKANNEQNVDTFGFALTTACLDHLNSFEGDQRTDEAGNVVKLFNRNGPVGQKVNDALNTASSQLTIDNIIHRIRTNTCAGCHHYSVGDKELGIDPKVLPDGWPGTLGSIDSFDSKACRASPLPASCRGFTQVTELETETGKDGQLVPPDPSLRFDDLNEIRQRRLSHLSFRGPDGANSRYKISDALKLLFIPQRYKLMMSYLNGVDKP